MTTAVKHEFVEKWEELWASPSEEKCRPVEQEGIDRFRLRDGKTRESLIAYDPQPFAQALQAAAERS